ncbi:DUF7522 family protein [Haloarcula nitratireducens]|uniref:Uncharacterized protein n=1 Tax=Haloarcula nitratireducens TaxID=2487749 RepID=A0AAW4P6E5_9EURY|nr:hypothetical protein [Halomicroarcula nitratireducens]MBX0293520.1 hypothetical protein [Halomicroarcula nitratireducens]
MAPAEPERVASYLEREVGDELRSVIYYAEDTFEVVYARADVRSQYTDRDLEKVRQELGITSFGKPAMEDLYVHGDLKCTVHCFENAIEMQFVASDAEGIAVALDPAAFVAQRTFVARCMEEAGFGYD